MLVELHVEALGVIERATLQLGQGLTALTGETGAGKTMLVEAIELLVGGRADSGVVRTGAAEARVEGRFVAGADEFVLTRVVPADGRSRAYVNGRPAAVSSLVDMTTGSVELHGQHVHQSLLTPSAQRAALDRAGGVDLAPLREAQAELTAIEAELATLGGDERARAREIDLLRYQVEELERAGLAGPDADVGEEATLASEEALLSDAQAHRESAAASYEALGADGGARDGLSAAIAAIAGRAPFHELHARLSVLAAELDEASAELRDVSERLEDDPARLEQLRERRQLLRDLCRKYGDDIGEVVAYHADASSRLAELESYAQRAAELDGERRRAADRLDRAAAAVGEARRRAAPPFAAAIERRLRRLAMPDAELSLVVGQPPSDPAGDDVTIVLAANPGVPAMPLAKVASGGELSRTMLALRLATSGADAVVDPDGDEESDRLDVRCLVFDEVDAGVGGAAATAVGEALAALGAHHQVLVVTHLAQVAALATTQIAVDKSVVDGVTRATAEVVTGDRRVEEIARMLSGSPASGSAREHAAELLARPGTVSSWARKRA